MSAKVAITPITKAKIPVIEFLFFSIFTWRQRSVCVVFFKTSGFRPLHFRLFLLFLWRNFVGISLAIVCIILVVVLIAIGCDMCLEFVRCNEFHLRISVTRHGVRLLHCPLRRFAVLCHAESSRLYAAR